MALFGKERTFASIVEPLRTIEADLSSYIGEQDNRKSALEEERKDIDSKIQTAETEKAKSEHTVTKIAELLGSDFEEKPVTDHPDSTE